MRNKFIITHSLLAELLYSSSFHDVVELVTLSILPSFLLPSPPPFLLLPVRVVVLLLRDNVATHVEENNYSVRTWGGQKFQKM